MKKKQGKKFVTQQHQTSVMDMTVDYMISEANNENSGSDDDFKEFEDAAPEEAEDRIYQEYKRRAGSAMGEQEIEVLARGADVS